MFTNQHPQKSTIEIDKVKQLLVLDNHTQMLKAKAAVIHAYNNAVVHQIEIKEYKKDRSLAQNRLQHHWHNELFEQKDKYEETKGHSIQDFRAFNKLHFGVPIMETDEYFSDLWSKTTDHLDYEYKLKVVLWFPVTRNMTIEQMTWYLTDVMTFWTQKGFKLTTDDDRYFEAMGITR